MSVSELDPRVKRTRHLLEDALLRLGAERGFAAITVQDIARKAEVNRATFYQHYRDKDDLIEQTTDRLVQDLLTVTGNQLDPRSVFSPDRVPLPFVRMFEEVGRHAELYRRLLQEDGTTGFASRLQAHHEELFLHTWQVSRYSASGFEVPTGIRARFAASATRGLLSWWLEHGQLERPEAMASWLWSLLRASWLTPASVNHLSGDVALAGD